MTTNNQASSAGQEADEIIKRLANPGESIETENATVEVLDQVTQVEPKEETQTIPKEDWKKRFTSYKSSTDDTIYSLRQENHQVHAEVESLKAQIEELKTQKPEVPDEFLDVFSKEELDVTKKVVSKEVKALQDKLKKLEEEKKRDVEATRIQTAESRRKRLVETVRQSVPNFQEVDSNPAFRAFLNEPDHFGNIRMALLEQAKASFPPDIDRIIAFYKEFLSLQDTTSQQRQFTQQELLQVPTSTPSNTVEQSNPSSGIVWNKHAIDKFYKDKATGKIGAQEAIALEKEMYASFRKIR